jgi:uncharacterized protein YbaR (Trm112 family)
VKNETLEILRCPYCGGRLELVDGLPHQLDAEEIVDGVIGCACCTFPVVSGIPVMHLQPESVSARDAIEKGEWGRAFRELIAPEDEESAQRFQELAGSPEITYAELVETLGASLEGGYFVYRFSDPSYVVASAVVSAVTGVVLKNGGRAIDLCGGSGHLTRLLLQRSNPAPVIADLFFAKVWLASRFVAPGCEPVCCDANAPLPFARGTFRYAMCADAFMFVWTKRQFVAEMMRLIDQPGPAAALITHTHNQLVWSHSHGQALTPAGYRDLFETIDARVFAEAGLLNDIIAAGRLDLSRRDSLETLDADPALTIVATRSEEVFGSHPPFAQPLGSGDLRINPLYQAAQQEGRVFLRLSFPSPEYEDEFGHSRLYLEEELVLETSLVEDVYAGRRTPEVKQLMGRRVVLEVPERYY